ncbi:tyrosine-type recombinase/integrase [Viridibacillus sp. NPDC096237]|uniref:tyrosine-type recombinase/integrase n=1 Tax=Viridibacillus sp. NPDC096237 TaxID=3390721 RepID=UPI003D023A6C
MVHTQRKDFDDLSVNFYLKNQKVYEEKRLTLDTVMAIQEYVKKYNLQTEDYLIGSILSNGNHEKYVSREISTRAYLNDFKKWTRLTEYNFRKAIVSDMHERGADLATIAKQTGHKSIKTINDHYLKVSNRTVDKFLP